MPGKILIADCSSASRILLKTKLSTVYYDVSDAATGEQVLLHARHDAPDVILLGTEMPDLDGFSLCRILKADPLTAHIPVILTSDGAASDRVRGLEAGADDFLSRPFADIALYARVRGLMRFKHELDELTMRDATSAELGLSEILGGGLDTDDYLDQDPDRGLGRVQIIPDTRATGLAWAGTLARRLPAAVSVSESETEALITARETPPDAFVIARSLIGGGDGLRLIAHLRAQADTRQSAIILVTGDGDLEAASQALDLGATDFIETPFDETELVARLRTQIRRKRVAEKLRLNLRDGLKLAVTDPLTGLYNRRYAASHMHKIMARARESETEFAVMLLDLDRFKRINDRYGHDAGDLVLEEFARRLQDNIRGIDLVARIGGEEFFVAMPDASSRDASRIAERVRSAVEDQPFRLPETSLTIRVTVSIGVAMADGTEKSPEAIMKRADKALFDSKHAGRNCVRFHLTAA